ncbi:flagellar biosynthesis protein FliQ [Desulfitispora alkaliphila]|uniref:hypothetical protein n=1 Tax=Desulfitispora alkaliphila TaxID=622674 RepID=UPI003D20C258
MIMIVGILVVGLLIALLEAPRLFKKKLWGELAVFSALLISGLALALYLTV